MEEATTVTKVVSCFCIYYRGQTPNEVPSAARPAAQFEKQRATYDMPSRWWLKRRISSNISSPSTYRSLPQPQRRHERLLLLCIFCSFTVSLVGSPFSTSVLMITTEQMITASLVRADGHDTPSRYIISTNIDGYAGDFIMTILMNTIIIFIQVDSAHLWIAFLLFFFIFLLIISYYYNHYYYRFTLMLPP